MQTLTKGIVTLVVIEVKVRTYSFFKVQEGLDLIVFLCSCRCHVRFKYNNQPTLYKYKIFKSACRRVLRVGHVGDAITEQGTRAKS